MLTGQPDTATYFANKARNRKAARLAQIIAQNGGTAWDVNKPAVRANAFARYRAEVPGATVPSDRTWGNVEAILLLSA